MTFYNNSIGTSSYDFNVTKDIIWKDLPIWISRVCHYFFCFEILDWKVFYSAFNKENYEDEHVVIPKLWAIA